MQRRHGAIFDAALKSVAHDQIVTRLEFFDEVVKGSEIVAVVRVAHDHELSMSGFDPHLQCIAIAALRDDDDARAMGFRDFNRSIGAAVIRDDDLAQKILSREIGSCFRNTGAKGPCLIEQGIRMESVISFSIGIGFGRVSGCLW